MKIELNGKITEASEWYELLIGDTCLSEITDDINGNMATLKYYISNEPIDKDTVIEKYLTSFYEGKIKSDSGYCSGSEWTGIYAKNDKLSVGKHNIIKELSSYIGKYCYLILETVS